ncbi:MAG: M60 family metallopeptidase [Kiritimatiellaeota bacterium]|nr:M60 family metallopeptidase [Kiritimatiellota bacterium]
MNFFSLYCMEHIVGKPTGEGHGALDGEKLFKALDRRLGTPPSTDPFDQLAPFVVLIRKYGWAPLKQTLVSYQAVPVARKTPEPQRQAEFVKRYSRNAKADLTGFFKQIGYTVPDELCVELKSLPAFDYAAWRKAPTTTKTAKP